MKKISKAQASAKKPVSVAIESTGAAEKTKFQRPDFRTQLSDYKNKNLKPAAPKPEPTTTSVEINVKEFNYTKLKPLKAGAWLIWKSAQGQLIVMPENRVKGQRFYPFEFADGFVFLVNKPNSQYAYFHATKFQEFLEKYGIHRVTRKDPNGEYQGRNDVQRNTVSVFSCVTDGKYTESTETTLTGNKQPLVKMNNASTFIKVEDASFVIFEQVAYRTDDVDVEPFLLRQIVSVYDIFTLEAEIAQACAHLDGPADEEVAAAAE
jgi:hypothetical protein